jgi:hypothetical protein
MSVAVASVVEAAVGAESAPVEPEAEEEEPPQPASRPISIAALSSAAQRRFVIMCILL